MPVNNILYNIGDALDNSRFSRHKRLTDKEKVVAGGMAVGLGVTAIAATVSTFFLVFPDRTEIADNWASDHGLDYTRLCYTPNPDTETELNIRNDAYWPVENTMEYMDATGPIGQGVSDDLVASDTIFCIGPEHDSGQAIYQQSMGRELYFVSENLSDLETELATSLFEQRGLYPTINGSLTQRENRYITSAALIWKRSTEAIKAVSHVDGIFAILSASGGADIFESAHWQDVAAMPGRSAAAQAFQSAYENSDQHYDARRNEARKAAFFAAVHSAELQEDTDVPFLQWYEGEVDEQPERRSRQVPSMCSNGEGGMRPCMKTEYYTVYVDPPSYVHSEDLHPATLVALSDIFTDAAPFLNLEEAQDLINDPQSLEFHNGRIRMIYHQAQTNARRYAGSHFQGRSEVGRGIRVDIDAQNYIAPER